MTEWLHGAELLDRVEPQQEDSQVDMVNKTSSRNTIYDSMCTFCSIKAMTIRWTSSLLHLESHPCQDYNEKSYFEVASPEPGLARLLRFYISHFAVI